MDPRFASFVSVDSYFPIPVAGVFLGALKHTSPPIRLFALSHLCLHYLVVIHSASSHLIPNLYYDLHMLARSAVCLKLVFADCIVYQTTLNRASKVAEMPEQEKGAGKSRSLPIVSPSDCG